VAETKTTRNVNPAPDPELRNYLRSRYRGVLDENGIEAHIRDYVGFGFANQVAPLVAARLSRPAALLDVGCGFGAFVIAARRLGLDAVGIDVAPFEVEFARRRLRNDLPEADPMAVFRLGDALHPPFPDAAFDAVTLWNVLEHVPDAEALLTAALRMLKRGGMLFLICPNYAAFRAEAHYQVFWPPLLPRRLAGPYLRLRGKAPAFLQECIFFRTNWGVLRLLQRLGLEIDDLWGPLPQTQFGAGMGPQTAPAASGEAGHAGDAALRHGCRAKPLAWAAAGVRALRRARRLVTRYNPCKSAIALLGRKVR
jgi:2-polyprenyl-3-methyl-5-hydroxy-6-metoxy-1,4-benzoquinol methylase